MPASPGAFAEIQQDFTVGPIKSAQNLGTAYFQLLATQIFKIKANFSTPECLTGMLVGFAIVINSII